LLDTNTEPMYPSSEDVAMLDPENDPDLLEGDGPSDEEMALSRDDSHVYVDTHQGSADEGEYDEDDEGDEDD
jgi:hypothetical protein